MITEAPRTYHLREVFNGLHWVARGRTVADDAKDLPPWEAAVFGLGQMVGPTFA
jgi:hypothetical protein